MIPEFENFLICCTLCPRKCGVNRTQGEMGYCNTGAGAYVSSVCIHRGEEPVISGRNGICNVFFGHCNMQCIFCQNYQISDNRSICQDYHLRERDLVEEIIRCLDRGIDALGFVSATHQIPQMVRIIRMVRQSGRHPVIVYNSNGYDSVELLKKLESVVDVYLPDFKYSDDSLAISLSGAPGYYSNALAAIQEMYRQVGSTLHVNSNGYAERGLIIRHLVLPGYTGNSIGALQSIAENISVNVHISLMSQYYPAHKAAQDNHLAGMLLPQEYRKVVAAMNRLGLSRGWIQEMASEGEYRPDFLRKHPFEE